jgi:hypothetical protein
VEIGLVKRVINRGNGSGGFKKWSGDLQVSRSKYWLHISNFWIQLFL